MNNSLMLLNLYAYEVDPGTFIIRLPPMVEHQNEDIFIIGCEVISNMVHSLEDENIFLNLQIFDYYYNGMPALGFTREYLSKYTKNVQELYDEAVKSGSRRIFSSIPITQITNIYDAVKVEEPNFFLVQRAKEKDISNDTDDIEIDFNNDNDDNKK